MRIGISAKLFLAILAACATVLTTNGIAGRISFERDFMGYLNDQGIERMNEVLPRLQKAYAQHGSLNFLRGNPQAWFMLMRPDIPDDNTALLPPPVSDQTGAVPRLAMLDAQGQHLIGNPDARADSIKVPLVMEGTTVGWLAMVPFQKAIAAGDKRFYEAQRKARWLDATASVLVAAILAWFLSRALLGRVRGLASTIHRLATGDYAHRIQIMGQDELGRLAADVNQLADTLEHIEGNRRSFMADISHELRTPLAVLRAELEAIQDGIHPMTPSTLAPLQGEVQQLGKLINDLHDLAVTQTGTLPYRFAVIDLEQALHHSVALVRTRFASAGLQLQLETALGPQLTEGDEQRLQQLFSNLLENSLRYTDAGGQVLVRLQAQENTVAVTIEDSAPGVAPAHLDRLFERFYRVEASRNRSSGGSGLGLAICRNIIESHRGSISAEASNLGGLRIVMTFPKLAA